MMLDLLRGLILALIGGASLLLGAGLLDAGYTTGWLLVLFFVILPALGWGGWVVVVVRLSDGRAGAERQLAHRVLRLAPAVLALWMVAAGALAVLQAESVLLPVYGGVLAVLGAWDLSLFFLRLRATGAVIGEQALIGRRLARLLLLALAAGGGPALVRIGDVGFNFDRVLGASLLLLLALGYLSRIAQRGGNRAS